MSLTADLLFGATLLPHFVYHRLVTGKYGACAPEKLGYGPARQGAAPCVWLHAVSVGETLAARPLVDAFTRAHPDWELRVSTTTATGRGVAEKHYGAARVLFLRVLPAPG